MYIVKDGDLYIKEGNKKYHLTSGDMFILDANVEHTGYLPAKCEYYYIHFKDVSLLKVIDSELNVYEALKDKRRKALLSDFLSYEHIDDGILYLAKKYKIHSNFQFDRLRYANELFYNKEEFYRHATSTLIHSFLLTISHKMLVEYLNEERKDNTKKSELICEQIIDYINTNY